MEIYNVGYEPVPDGTPAVVTTIGLIGSKKGFLWRVIITEKTIGLQ